MKLLKLGSTFWEKEKIMKRFLFISLMLTLGLSGAISCGESANQEGGSPVVTDQNTPTNPPSNNATDVPADLGGTNLNPPPAPPSH